MNTVPVFKSSNGKIRQSFEMDMGDTYEYKLPPVEDRENNDEIILSVLPMEGKEDQYPPFLFFDEF